MCLQGYTQGERNEIFALHAAPIQVLWDPATCHICLCHLFPRTTDRPGICYAILLHHMFAAATVNNTKL